MTRVARPPPPRKKRMGLLKADASVESASMLPVKVSTPTVLPSDIDPEGYLRYVVGCIAEHPINRIDDLLPWAVSGEHATDNRLAA